MLYHFFCFKNRLCIDLDDYSFYDMVKKVAFGCNLLRCKFDVYLSCSKKGYHIIFYKKLPIFLILLFRFIIGDDIRRLRFDFSRTLIGNIEVFDLLFSRYRFKNQKNWKKRLKITNLVIQHLYKRNLPFANISKHKKLKKMNPIWIEIIIYLLVRYAVQRYMISRMPKYAQLELREKSEGYLI